MSALPEGVVDESNCATEPIHIPGKIQPHGVLVVLAENDLRVTDVSANTMEHFGVSADAVLDGSMRVVLDTDYYRQFEESVRQLDAPSMNPMHLTLDTLHGLRDFECVTHRSGASYVAEFTSCESLRTYWRPEWFSDVRSPIAHMESAGDLTTLLNGCAQDIRHLSGFDRVMIYEFSEDWHGEVVAEAAADDLDARFLNMHFPASDIPEQARRLYLKSPLRVIADVDYQPVPLVSRRADIERAPVDLSLANLRSVSPIHIEYLQNMGVRATMVISIVVGERLWGLISCHHYRPRRINFALRTVCELLGHMLSWQVGSRREAALVQEQIRANATLSSFSERLAAATDLTTAMGDFAPALLSLFESSALAQRSDGLLRRFGPAPDAAVCERIAAALKRRIENGVAATHSVRELLAESDSVVPASASGALLVTLAESEEDYLLLLRPELARTIDWSGDIRSKVRLPGGTLHPRASFELWREVVRDQSLPWTQIEKASAYGLRSRFLERSRALDRHRVEERIRYLAHHDALTKLPNRSSFNDALRETIAAAQRDGSMFAVLFIDLDRFKVFNDAFGHATGDLILQKSSERMRATVRRGDIVARLGGDEFVVVLPRIQDELEAEHVAGKLVAAISEPFSIGGASEIRCTASVGISIYPKDGSDADTLIANADRGMYRAKEHGRDTFRHFGDDSVGPSATRISLEHDIHRGLARGEFVPYYQPVVDLRSGRIDVFEALARWIHPDSGVLSPLRFIAVAEESRLIITLGEAILRAACAEAARWRGHSQSADIRVSVNVSALQFRDATFFQTVLDALRESGLEPHALQLELTESLLMGEEAAAMQILDALAKAGVGISVDDFGTGFSSLSYLQRLPVNTLKIDRSFVTDIDSNGKTLPIVRAVIAMGHSLHLNVIAEGVETQEQLRLLHAEGCDEAQGYFYSQPLPAKGVEEFIAAFHA